MVPMHVLPIVRAMYDVKSSASYRSLSHPSTGGLMCVTPADCDAPADAAHRTISYGDPSIIWVPNRKYIDD
jgi:hypothetical protein